MDGIYRGGILNKLRPVVLSKIELYNVNIVKISYFYKNHSVQVHFKESLKLSRGDAVRVVNTHGGTFDGIYILVEQIEQIAYLACFDKISDRQNNFSLDGGEHQGYMSEVLNNGFVTILSLHHESVFDFFFEIEITFFLFSAY